MPSDKRKGTFMEEGGRRTSSTFHDLTHFDHDHMHGRFESTIANESGEVVWDRRGFEQLPKASESPECGHTFPLTSNLDGER